MYKLVSAHHARLSEGVEFLVRKWLLHANLSEIGVIIPCQWVNIRDKYIHLRFFWPCDLSRQYQRQTNQVCIPVLILVHGRVSPPGSYELWIDDDGPCLIERVCLDDVYIQRPLLRAPFVTTLFPVYSNAPRPNEHQVSVYFKELQQSRPSSRPTCIAVMAVAVAIGWNGGSTSNITTIPSTTSVF